MRVFLGLAALHYASPAEGKPLMNHMIQELAAPLQPRQQSTFAVTGVTQFGVQPRIEIRQMQQDTDLWNIYIFGLVRMMQVNQSEQLSYYQIAGKSAASSSFSSSPMLNMNSQVSMAGHTSHGMACKRLRIPPGQGTVHTCPTSSCPGTGHIWPCMRYVEDTDIH